MDESPYQIWKKRLWNQPLKSGAAGLALVLFTIIATVFGALMASALVWGISPNASKIGRLLAHILAIPVAAFGLIFFMLLRPLAWRLTREYRLTRDHDRLTKVFNPPDAPSNRQS